ncbi:MAG TPA: hypothetical protein VMN39_04050, partial [Longimicrobiaceae bacterium]|nr:hypothetical protein [Longimicrobiaceae bacterium]
MISRLLDRSILWLPLVLLAVGSTAAGAQVVPIRTVPVATGDQFLLYPSTRMGMAGLSIALDDELHDPFVNPAAGARLRRSYIFGSPAFYHITGGDGSGATLPLGLLASGDRWFGAVSLALQEIDSGNGFGGCCVVFERTNIVNWDPNALQNRSATNHYLYGSLGRRVSRRTAVGFSAGHADLNAVDGVDLLYASS